jgi:UDP-glucose 4-epimerase
MILLTGGLGFIGAHTTRALLDLGQRCVVVQRRPRQVPDFLTADAGDLILEQADCSDLSSLLEVGKRHKITGIVHLAAAGIGEGGALAQLHANLQASFAVLGAAQEWGMARLVQASTIGVYAGVSTTAYQEEALLPVRSAHLIPAYKKSAEILAEAVASSTGLDIVSVRIGAIWGPLGPKRSPFLAAPQLVHAVVHPDRGETDALVPPYVADGIDMLYVRDCARAIALLQTAHALPHRTYNIGSGRITTNRDVAEAIMRAAPGARPALAKGRNPNAPAADAILDISRLRHDTGFQTRYDLDAAVADYLSWLQAGHPN